MRAIIEAIGGHKMPDHVGLAYERYAPLERGTGKISPAKRNLWLEALAEQRCPADYAHAYRQWRDHFEADGSNFEIVKLASRLLVGHGNASPTEVGLTVHHTWGVPMIPGSALKGLLNHYIDAVYGPGNLTVHPMDTALSGEMKERARFRGVTWNEKGTAPKYGPGEIHRELFGAPATETDAAFAPDAGETRGRVVFHDALYVPGSVNHDAPFATDVLTVHQKNYYAQQRRNVGPTDWDEPNPVSLLTVKPGARFLIALSGPRDWTAFALRELLDALELWRIGGKTSAGYGRMVRAGEGTLTEREQKRLAAEVEERALTERRVASQLEITRMMNEIKMNNAAQLLERIYAIVLPENLSAMARQVIEKLGRKSLKDDKPWVRKLLLAAEGNVGSKP